MYSSKKFWGYSSDGRAVALQASGPEFDPPYLHQNSISYIETKGFIRENDELKWEMCKKLNLNLKVWFKSDIDKAEQFAEVADVVLALS